MLVNRKPVSLTLPELLYDKLYWYCWREGKMRTRVIEKAIEQYLDGKGLLDELKRTAEADTGES